MPPYIKNGRNKPKLDKQAVAEIRASDLPQPVLADKYGVSQKAISQVNLGRLNGNNVGRPSLFSDELAHEFLERLKTRTSHDITTNDDDMPCMRTIQTWMATKDEFCSAVRESRRQYYDHWLAKMTEIVDKCDEATWKSARIKFDAALRMAERVVPEVYGVQNRNQVDITVRSILVPYREPKQLLPPLDPPLLEAETILDADVEGVKNDQMAE